MLVTQRNLITISKSFDKKFTSKMSELFLFVVIFDCLCYTFSMIIGLICACIVIALDQLTKFLVYGTVSRSVIGNLLWFESTLNTGVAFSMFEGNSLLFFIISMVASCGILYLLISKKWFNGILEKISLGLILGGTISNAIDRLVFKGVRDFIYLKFINFAIFNLADFAITVGVILFCFSIIFLRKKTDDRTQLGD